MSLKNEGFSTRAIGNGSTVYDQIPKPGAKVSVGTQVILYLERNVKQDAQRNKMMLPNFQGLSLRKVNQVCAEIGLMLEAQGIGVAVSQEPAPGTVVIQGSIIKVRFEVKTDYLE